MRSTDLGRYALSSCVAAAMLAACGGSQPPIGAPGAMPLQPWTTSARATRRKIFDYTGGMQTFKVPVRVNQSYGYGQRC